MNATDEIERKFIISELSPALRSAIVNPNCDMFERREYIAQGYVLADEQGELRVRCKGTGYFVTLKGDGDLKRLEDEAEIGRRPFDVIWHRARAMSLRKVRGTFLYEKMPHCGVLPDELGGLVAELDVYEGDLSGRLVIEIEFDSEESSAIFTPPSWWEEVTKRKEFKNKNLARNGWPAGTLRWDIPELSKVMPHAIAMPSPVIA